MSFKIVINRKKYKCCLLYSVSIVQFVICEIIKFVGTLDAVLKESLYSPAYNESNYNHTEGQPPLNSRATIPSPGVCMGSVGHGMKLFSN